MRLGIVIGTVVSTDKHRAYQARSLRLVQRLTTGGEKMGMPTMAIDYVGSAKGNIVLLGAAPGLASKVLKIEKAPVQQLIMGIVDTIECQGKKFEAEEFSNNFLTD